MTRKFVDLSIWLENDVVSVALQRWQEGSRRVFCGCLVHCRKQSAQRGRSGLKGI